MQASVGPGAARTGLGPLLEESKQASTSNGPSTRLNAAADDGADSAEPIPTLSSLLLSTAASLGARTNAATTKSTKAQPAQPPQLDPATVRSLITEPSSTAYLSSLLDLPLASLQSLPSSLHSLSAQLDTDLSSLAFTRYSAFLLAHEANVAISSSFSTLSGALGSLLDSTAGLESAAGAFEERVHAVRLKRARMARVRERMEEVEELLEAPAVVVGCVRAGYWAEAIDVAVRLTELHARLSLDYDNPSQLAVGVDGEGISSGGGALLLLNRVRDEVSLALLSLRASVLESLLQRSLKLPGAVRAIGILRRIGEQGLALTTADNSAPATAAASGELDEQALRIVFLAARWRCLRGELESVEGQMAASGIRLVSKQAQDQPEDNVNQALVGVEENDERTRWTKRWIEVWREVIGESVGMYAQVFLPDEHSTNDNSLPATAPLNLFLASAVSSLSTTLTSALPSLTSPSSLSALLTQLSYCSHSFARYGLEFAELLQVRERVEQRVGQIVMLELESAGLKWEKEWRDGWSSTARRTANGRREVGPTVAEWLVVPEGLQTVLHTALPSAQEASDEFGRKDTWHHQPPAQLALLPPLARLLNAHASALNALRLLPPLSIAPLLILAQARELDRASQVLAAFIDAWFAAFETRRVARELIEDPSDEEHALAIKEENEKKLVAFAVGALGRWLVPWTEAALRIGVYGEVGPVEGQGRARAVEDAMARAEALIAKIEGRRDAEEDVQQTTTRAEEVAPAPAPVLESVPAPDAPVEAEDVVKPIVIDAPVEQLPPAPAADDIEVQPEIEPVAVPDPEPVPAEPERELEPAPAPIAVEESIPEQVAPVEESVAVAASVLEVEPEAETEQEPAPEAASLPDPEPEVVEAEAEVETAPVAAVEPEAEPEPVLEVEPEPESAPEPVPEPGIEAAPEPELVPEPTPVTAPVEEEVAAPEEDEEVDEDADAWGV